MKIEHIAIAVPVEGPQAPEGWTFVGYSVVDDSFNSVWPQPKIHDPKDLESAGRYYAYQGSEIHSIVAEYKHCDADGCYNIYCQFERNYERGDELDDLYKWGEWLSFDFSLLEAIDEAGNAAADEAEAAHDRWVADGEVAAAEAAALADEYGPNY